MTSNLRVFKISYNFRLQTDNVFSKINALLMYWINKSNSYFHFLGKVQYMNLLENYGLQGCETALLSCQWVSTFQGHTLRHTKQQSSITRVYKLKIHMNFFSVQITQRYRNNGTWLKISTSKRIPHYKRD